MGFLDEIGNLLQRYQGADANNPPPEVERDFQQVAGKVPKPVLAGGLNNAFRSSDTPPFGQMVAGLFGQSNGDQKAGILNQLLHGVNLSALSGAGLSGLSGMLQGRSPVTPDLASQVSPDDVGKLADHSAQQDPSVVDRASQFYAEHPTLVQGLGAGALALMMSHLSRQG